MANIDKLVEAGRQRILGMDPDAMAQRLGLDDDGEALYVELLGRRIRIGRDDMRMRYEETGETCGPNATLFLYDLLGHTDKSVVIAREWATLRQLSGMQGGAVNPEGLFAKYLVAFDGHADALAHACKQLGGTPAGGADVASVIPTCKWVPLLFKFNESDEEFPAQMTMLFDANLRDYLCYETIWYLMMDVCECLAELAGLGPVGLYHDRRG